MGLGLFGEFHISRVWGNTVGLRDKLCSFPIIMLIKISRTLMKSSAKICALFHCLDIEMLVGIGGICLGNEN